MMLIISLITGASHQSAESIKLISKWDNTQRLPIRLPLMPLLSFNIIKPKRKVSLPLSTLHMKITKSPSLTFCSVVRWVGFPWTKYKWRLTIIESSKALKIYWFPLLKMTNSISSIYLELLTLSSVIKCSDMNELLIPKLKSKGSKIQEKNSYWKLKQSRTLTMRIMFDFTQWLLMKLEYSKL